MSTPAFENSSFETPDLTPNTWIEPAGGESGWDGTGHFGIANGESAWGAGGKSGNQYAFIQMGGTMSQTVSGLEVGQTYRVSFWIARRNGNVGGDKGEALSIAANGEQILAPTGPKNDGTWAQVSSNPFVTTEGTCEFVFQGHGNEDEDSSTLIDDVSLALVS